MLINTDIQNQGFCEKGNYCYNKSNYYTNWLDTELIIMKNSPVFFEFSIKKIYGRHYNDEENKIGKKTVNKQSYFLFSHLFCHTFCVVHALPAGHERDNIALNPNAI